MKTSTPQIYCTYTHKHSNIERADNGVCYPEWL